MFVRRTLAIGALAIAGFSGTAQADTPTTSTTPSTPATTTAGPTVLPLTVVTRSTPVASERTRRFGFRRNRTTTPTVTTPSIVQAQATVPMPMPMPSTTTTPAAATTPATTPSTTPATSATPSVADNVLVPATTVSTSRVRPMRAGLISRIFGRR